MPKTPPPPRIPVSHQAPLRVLLVEHDPNDVELCLIELKRAGFDPRMDVVQNEQQFSAFVRANHYDLVLADYRLPNWTGLDALLRLQELKKDIPLILVTGTLGEEKAVECMKRGVADYVLKDQLSRLPVAVRRVLGEGAMREEQQALRKSEDAFRLMIWRHLSKQGNIMYMEIHAHSLLFAGRQAILAVAQDVTQRLRAEEGLRESEARYRGLFEHAPYGIYRATHQGDILDVNPALAAMLGYASVEDLVALKDVRQLFRDPRDRARFLAMHKDRGRIDTEVEWKRKDGQTLLIRLNGRLVPKELGREECFEVMVEDVTSRRSLEKQLQEMQKFEAIGQLAGGIAHDFNNMVGAILG